MREITFSQAINEALAEEMERDGNVVLLGEDVGLKGGAFGVTKDLWQRFGPERVRDTPISEGTIAGAAVGAALTGLRPVAEIMYIDFITLAMDQIVNQAAKIRYMYGGGVTVPLVIRTQGGGGRGNAAQHSQALEAWFCHVPGLLVVMPSTPYEAKGLLKSAIRDDNPVVFIEHKFLYAGRGEVPEDVYTSPLGKAAVKRKGDDVTIIATSRMVSRALAAAEALASQGVEAEVIDPRTLVPLDLETVLDSVRKTGRVVVVHEACRRGGYGAEIAATISEQAFDYLDAPVQRVGALNTPIPYAKVLEDYVLPDEGRIADAVKGIL